MSQRSVLDVCLNHVSAVYLSDSPKKPTTTIPTQKNKGKEKKERENGKDQQPKTCSKVKRTEMKSDHIQNPKINIALFPALATYITILRILSTILASLSLSLSLSLSVFRLFDLYHSCPRRRRRRTHFFSGSFLFSQIKYLLHSGISLLGLFLMHIYIFVLFLHFLLYGFRKF